MTLLARDDNNTTIQALGFGTVQNVAIGSASVTLGAVFGFPTRVARLTPDVDCWVTIDFNPATASPTVGARLIGGVTEYVKVAPGMTLKVIQAQTSGNLNVVECN